MTRAGQLARGLIALVALLALVGGLPWALWDYIGWPLPHALPSWGQVTTGLSAHGIPDQVLLKALACVVWVGWALLVAAVASETAAAARGRAATRIRVAGPLQPLAAHLVAAIALAALAVAVHPGPAAHASLAATLPAPPGTAVSLQLTDTATASLTSPSVPPPDTSDHRPAASPPAATREYVVQRRDTLWGIADRQLGDPLQWSKIYALNHGRSMPDGRVFDDPNRIWPGWTLLLPAAAPASAAPTPTTGPPPTPGPAPNGAPSPTPAPAPVTPIPAGPTATPSPSVTGRAPSHLPAPAEDQPRPVVVSPVELPTGSVVAGSFAAGVAAALALGRLRRRHAYQPRPPQPGRCLAPSPLGPTLRRLSTVTRPLHDADDGDHGPATEERLGVLPSDDPARREQPDLIEVGTVADRPVRLALIQLAGVSLTGPGGDDVARAWITAVLVRAGPLAAEILITSAARDRLLPGLPDAPGLQIVDHPETLLRRLEVATISRTRQLDALDAVAYRRANTYEPLPTLLAVTDTVPSEQTGRWRATLSTGARLAIGAVLLDPSDATATHLTIDASRCAAVAIPAAVAQQLAGARLFTITADDALDVIDALAHSEQRPTSSDTDRLDQNGVADNGDGPSPTPAVGPVDATGALGEPPTEPWPAQPVAEPTAPQPTPLLHRSPPGNEPAATAPITVRLLGPYVIAVDGNPVTTGLRSVAKELLAWYLLRPDGATVDAAVEALWPDTDPKQVHRQFWLAASNLRTRLRSSAHPDAKVLAQTGDVYQPQAELIVCDLWDFQAALRAAAHAGDDAAAGRGALQRAVDAYHGDFAATTDYLWAEPVRADLHRRALDAHLRLAELEDRLDHPEGAVAALERAVTLDGVAEEPYRRLMTAQARLGRPDALRGTWRALQRRLAVLDIDPEPATVRLYRTLTSPADDESANRRRPSSRLGADR